MFIPVNTIIITLYYIYFTVSWSAQNGARNNSYQTHWEQPAVPKAVVFFFSVQEGHESQKMFDADMTYEYSVYII